MKDRKISDGNLDGRKVAIGVIILVLVFLIILYALLLTGLYRIYISNPSRRFDIMSVAVTGFSAVASSSLSLALVYLYYKISKINEDQKEIAERQVKLEEAQNKPSIIIEDVKYTDDHIALKIANEGTGLAKDFHIRCDGFSLSLRDGSSNKWDIENFFSEDSKDFQITPKENKLYQISGDSIKDRLETRSIDIEITDRSVLRPGDSAWYRHRTDLGWMTTEGQPPQSSGRVGTSFSDTMTTLDDAGVEEMCFQITLIFSDISDSLDAQRIIGIPVEIDSNLSVEEANNQPRGGGCMLLTEKILKDVCKFRITGK